MGNEKNGAIKPITESQIAAIDQDKLPQVFVDQVRLLEAANQEFNNAEEKERQARLKVTRALQKADALINAARKVGGNTAEQKKFLFWEWTSNRDEIDAIKLNLQEIIKHSGNSAEAQKKLAEVQSSLMESQSAILRVQKAHMEYQRQIANTTKFVFGLSAYNMAISQSIYENLTAILSNESPEKMGELAQQQLFLALDQIRNQESIITRIKENDNMIEDLSCEIDRKQEEIDNIINIYQEQNRLIVEGIGKNQEQDAQITENAQNIDALEQQDAKQDELIAEGIEKDKTQDAQISENAQDIDALEQQDAEQDELIAEGIEKDKTQDAQIFENAQSIDALEQQDIAQSKILTELIEQNKLQDTTISHQEELLKEQANAIQKLEQKIESLNQEKGDKIFMYLATAATIVALILSVLHFFI